MIFLKKKTALEICTKVSLGLLLSLNLNAKNVLEKGEHGNEKVYPSGKFISTSTAPCEGSRVSGDQFAIDLDNQGIPLQSAMDAISNAHPLLAQKMKHNLKSSINVCVTDIGKTCGINDGKDHVRAAIWLNKGDITKDRICLDKEKYFVSNANSNTDKAAVFIRELLAPVLSRNLSMTTDQIDMIQNTITYSLSQYLKGNLQAGENLKEELKVFAVLRDDDPKYFFEWKNICSNPEYTNWCAKNSSREFLLSWHTKLSTFDLSSSAIPIYKAALKNYDQSKCVDKLTYDNVCSFQYFTALLGLRVSDSESKKFFQDIVETISGEDKLIAIGRAIESGATDYMRQEDIYQSLLDYIDSEELTTAFESMKKKDGFGKNYSDLIYYGHAVMIREALTTFLMYFPSNDPRIEIIIDQFASGNYMSEPYVGNRYMLTAISTKHFESYCDTVRSLPNKTAMHIQELIKNKTFGFELLAKLVNEQCLPKFKDKNHNSDIVEALNLSYLPSYFVGQYNNKKYLVNQ